MKTILSKLYAKNILEQKLEIKLPVKNYVVVRDVQIPKARPEKDCNIYVSSFGCTIDLKALKLKNDSMTEDLRRALEEKKVVLGSRRTIKYLKLGKVKRIVMASNCPEEVRKDLEHYVKLTGIQMEKFDGTAKQLGVFCGKPFSISTLAVLSETK